MGESSLPGSSAQQEAGLAGWVTGMGWPAGQPLTAWNGFECGVSRDEAEADRYGGLLARLHGNGCVGREEVNQGESLAMIPVGNGPRARSDAKCSRRG